MSATETDTVLAARDLRAASDWLDAHPDLPAPFAIHRHVSGVSLSWRTTDEADARSLWELTDDDAFSRSEHTYAAGDHALILSGQLGNDRLTLTVAVATQAVTA